MKDVDHPRYALTGTEISTAIAGDRKIEGAE